MKILIDESTVKQALNYLETAAFRDSDRDEAITALRSALQAADNVDPVAWHGVTGDYGFAFLSFHEQPGMTPLYAAPPVQG